MSSPGAHLVRRPKYPHRTDTLERVISVGIGLQQVQMACLGQFGLTRLGAGILHLVSTRPARPIKLNLMKEPEEPIWTAKLLARRLQCSEPTLSEELGSLEKRQLIARERGVDRRMFTVTPTEEGNRIANAYDARIGEESRRIFKGMSMEWGDALDKLERRIPGVTMRRVRRVPSA